MAEEPQEYMSDPAELNQVITSLSIEVRTVDAPFADTDNKVYCNVVFKDESQLFAPRNFEMDTAEYRTD